LSREAVALGKNVFKLISEQCEIEPSLWFRMAN
jgi:hypothetical protein